MSRPWIIKLGTGVLTKGIGEVRPEVIAGLCGDVARLSKQGRPIVLVSSAAIAVGMGLLGHRARPEFLPQLQACAAVGQGVLFNWWREGLEAHGRVAAQVLLTREDVGGRRRHLNARNTLEALLAASVIPVVNENDTVSADEIRFGDNDILSALVAAMIDAEHLIILSTAPGLMDREGTGRIIPLVETIDARIEALAGGTDSPTAVGGMRAKIEAAKIATRCGCAVTITAGDEAGTLLQLAAGNACGTRFEAAVGSLQARKRWLAFFQRPAGTLHLDAGAVEAVAHRGRSLLAKGITRVEGAFSAPATVELANPSGLVFARGLTHFDAAQITQVRGCSNDEIQSRLGSPQRAEIVHRDELVITAPV